MRHFIRIAVPAVVLAAGLGCGGSETKLPPPMTEEQKRASQEEDKRVFDEEGGKPQKAAKPAKR